MVVGFPLLSKFCTSLSCSVLFSFSYIGNSCRYNNVYIYMNHAQSTYCIYITLLTVFLKVREKIPWSLTCICVMTLTAHCKRCKVLAKNSVLLINHHVEYMLFCCAGVLLSPSCHISRNSLPRPLTQCPSMHWLHENSQFALSNQRPYWSAFVSHKSLPISVLQRFGVFITESWDL